MSVPLEGLAIYDTDERISRARVMAEYRRHALEELNHIRTFQEQHPLHHCEADTAPGRLSAPKDTENEVPESVAKHPATPMLPGVTEKRLAAACATANNTTQTPRKPGSKIKSMFSRVPKKKVLQPYPYMLLYTTNPPFLLPQPSSAKSVARSLSATSPISATLWARSP